MGRPDLLTRVLSVFAKVRPGEGPTVLLLAVNLFTLLTAYYMIKIVRETLILSGGGAETKVYTAAGQTLLLIPVVAIFAKLAERVDRVRLITYVTLFFVSNLAVFYGLHRMNFELGVPFFLWVGIFNNTVISQSWAFANDLYTREEGERLFPIVAIGSACGAVAGAALVSQLQKFFGKGNIEVWMLVAGGLLVFCIWLVRLADRRERRRTSEETEEPPPQEPMGNRGVLSLVLKERYLLLIALMILTLNWVNTTGEYLIDRLLLAAAQQAADQAAAVGAARDLVVKQYVGAFKADLFFWVNLLGMVFQSFVVSRVLALVGVRVAILILPLVALGGYVALAAAPLLAVIRISKTAENSLDYSLQNTVRQALFLVTSREEKYKAKVAIDTLVVRMGDLAAAALVVLGMTFAFEVQHFVYSAMVLAALWLGFSLLIGVEYKRRATD